MNQLAQQLGIFQFVIKTRPRSHLHHVDIKEFRDWYRVTWKHLKKVGGGGLLSQHGSLYHLLSTVYPEYLSYLHYSWLAWYKWDSSHFHLRGYWDDMKNQRRKMKELSAKFSMLIHVTVGSSTIPYYSDFLGATLLHQGNQSSMESLNYWISSADQPVDIKEPTDWYNVTVASFWRAGGRSLYRHYSSMSALLSSVFPEYLSVLSSTLIQLFWLEIWLVHNTSSRSNRV